MQYSETKPHGFSEHFVKLYWELAYSRNEMSGPEPVLPNGCVEIIFDFRDRFMTYHSGAVAEIQPRSIVAGQLTTRLMIGPSGETDMFGVRLRYESAFSLLGISMIEIRDQIVDLHDVLGSVENELFEKLAAANGLNERISIFEKYLFTLNARPVCAELSECVSILRSTSGAKQIAHCAANLRWSERRLERTFNEQIGLSPKLFARIIRFQSLLASAEKDRPSLLDHAIAVGYYDQSHMIRDFRSFAGVTPMEYFGRDLILSGLFVDA
ncbi:MAG: AraC family transcriptional regulator [Pyrinomonadaceae bacterium]|nr:AraC family transcriptional regulator [Pyrinomonadaceae bacterium]MBP6212545.1 AraC family transcriptional regulator [Pyrinomonadaceae bacterium]